MPEQWETRRDAWGEPTDWSMVVDAGRTAQGTSAERSWQGLIQRYRRPVEKAVRRKLWDGTRTEELTDSFFSYLYSEGVLKKADPDRGRFRCYLQGVLRRFLARELSRRNQRTVPLDRDVPVTETPEIERQEEADWATAVLRSAIEALSQENRRGAELLLRLHGVDPWPVTSTEALCAEYELKANALYQAVFRARGRLRELVLDEIRSTVTTEQDYTEEKRVIVARLLEAWSHVFVEPT